LFGIGILRFVRRVEQSKQIGTIAAWLYIMMGGLSVMTATIFPQDPWGSPPTFPGEMHIRLTGVVGLLSGCSILLLGIWFIRTRISLGLGVYSFITVGVVILSSVWLIASVDSPIMGLTERISALIGFQWTFVLGLWLYANGGTVERE
jgi:hypothetical protein